VLSDKGTVHLFELPASTVGKRDPIRAAGQWKMGAYERSVVEFVSSGILALVKLNSAELEMLRYTPGSRKIGLHSKVNLVDVGNRALVGYRKCHRSGPLKSAEAT
jgi:hypothetical protein